MVLLRCEKVTYHKFKRTFKIKNNIMQMGY